jgi:hypothetical protein
MPYRALVLLLAGALACPCALAAQASPHLQPLDQVHRDLDRLAAWGLIDTILVGQRPYSRAQAARMTVQAMRGRAALSPDAPHARTADDLLGRLTDRLALELEALGVQPARDASRLVKETRLDATWMDSPARDVPSNGPGFSMARINPLVAYDQGRGVVDGATIGLEFEIGGALGDRVAATIRPRAQLARPRGGGSDATLELASGHARLLLGNLGVTVGRDHVVWGQSPRGGLVLSTNAGALPLVSLATERPVVLPGPLRLLGPSTYQLFLGDLGTEGQAFDHSQLFGWRLSFLPNRRLEIGAEFLVQSGGEGAPESSLRDRILDYLFFPDLFSNTELQASNKVAGLDARVRVPEARGLELWVELAIDDVDIDRFKSMIWEDGAWNVGLALARLDAAGRLGVRLEGHHTGLRMYEHFDFNGGLTLDRHFLGSELGPRADGATLTVDWEPDGRNALTLEGSVEKRSADPYTLIAGTPYYFSRLDILHKEKRWRGRAAWERFADGGGLGVRVEGGYERVENFYFEDGGALHNLMMRTVLVARLP